MKLDDITTIINKVIEDERVEKHIESKGHFIIYDKEDIKEDTFIYTIFIDFINNDFLPKRVCTVSIKHPVQYTTRKYNRVLNTFSKIVIEDVRNRCIKESYLKLISILRCNKGDLKYEKFLLGTYNS